MNVGSREVQFAVCVLLSIADDEGTTFCMPGG